MKKKKYTSLAYSAFYNPEMRVFAVVNDFLATLTLASVCALILQTVPRFAAYQEIFTWVEYTTVFFFTFEYLARVYVKRRDVGAYIFSFFGIIDLLAIVPTFVGLSNLTFLKTARVLRILRLLRMVRLAKIVHLQKHRKQDVEDYKSIYRLNVGIYFFALFSALTLFGTLIYIFEGTNPEFQSIPLGMLWAIKPLMGGVAQLEPQTIWGEMVAICARFTGLILFGLLIAIVGGFAKKILFGTIDIDSATSKT